MNGRHPHKPISNSDELLFSVLCVENVAKRLGIPGGDAYSKLVQGDIIKDTSSPTSTCCTPRASNTSPTTS